MRTSGRRLFATFALISLVPVIALAVVLASVTQRQANARGLAQAKSQAKLLSLTVVEPLLDGTRLASGLSMAKRTELFGSVASAIRNHEVLRLRLRDIQGRIVFSDDGQLGDGAVDAEAAEAAEGKAEAHITTMGGDAGDHSGPPVVEVYEPLYSPDRHTVIGVVELYVPYADIAHDLRSQRRSLLAVLGGGLLGLWLALIGLAMWTSRRLRHSSEANAFLARHDALTGLPNRAQFAEHAAEAVGRGASVIALVDLDRFKQVNDTLGHAIGDRLLTELAGRLRGHLREGDVVARLGGDEFGLVLFDVQDESEAVQTLCRVRSLISEPLVVDDLPLAVESSVGFVMVPDDGDDVEALLAKADVAMYAAKRGHLGATRHHSEHEQYDTASLRLIGELAEGIANGQLVLHYQPKTDLALGRINAVEALVRWQHPERGLLYPDAFLFAAEQTELVEPLTRWVLREALLALPRLDPTGELSMAVNVSARSLGRLDFAEEVLEVLLQTKTAPSRLLVEITETALLVDPARAAATLSRLASAGVRVSIDDFGAGQTSLGYLATLPVHELKIDRAFVMAMDREPRNAAIVRSVIDLAHNLGFHVTAEGVETAEVLADLHAADCDSVQGYFLARPAEESVIRDRLRSAAFS